MSVRIVGLPHPSDEKIANIKALRSAMLPEWGLKEAKFAVEDVASAGYCEVAASSEAIKSLRAAGFKVEGDAVAKAEEERIALVTKQFIAVGQIMQEALDGDDPDLMEVMMPAYKLLSGRGGKAKA